jgi:hypothetical protein
MLAGARTAAVWFSRDDKTKIFYPFGASRPGYLVPNERSDEIKHWTYWRAQLPLILWTLGFVPLICLWAPSLSSSHRLEPRYFVLALALLTGIAVVGGWLGNRAAYARLLKDCPRFDRAPSRAEQRNSTMQFGATSRNFIYLPLPLAFLGLVVCAATMFLGAVREDIPLWLLGAVVSPLFWYAFVKEGVDKALRQIAERA